LARLFSSEAVANHLYERNESTENELDAELTRQGFVRSQFSPPDFGRDLDVEALRAAAPRNAMVKGMYFETLARAARGLNLRCGSHYVAFRDYPMAEYTDLLVRYSRARHGALPLREALRRAGWEAFPAMMTSIAGRVIFAVAGRDIEAALKLVPKAYEHSIKPGRVRAAFVSSHQAVLEFRDIWNFADSYQVGVLEGGCFEYQKLTKVELDVHSPSSVDMLVRW
jgi:uncharacterized protein (TIGR02265 family)